MRIDSPVWPAFSKFGIELEYMIVDRSTLNVRAMADRLLAAFARQPPATGNASTVECSNEFVMHLIEIKNRAPTNDLEQLRHAFHSQIGRLNRLLETESACLMPTGMHPWMDPRHETKIWNLADAGLYETYARLFDTRSHGWANLQSMHINLPFQDEQEFVRLHAAIRVVLPILPAIAASSPFADGVDSGYADYRLEVYRQNARSLPAITGQVIPEIVDGYDDYRQKILLPMYRDIAAYDSAGVLQHEWLNARGAIARFDRQAIEIRLLDTQECVQSDLAIAAAVIDVIKSLYLSNISLSVLQQNSLPDLADLLLACIKKGGQAIITDKAYLRLFGMCQKKASADELWSELLAERIQPGGSLYTWRAPLSFLLAHGNLAKRISLAVGDEPSMARLHQVYGKLCACLSRDEMFSPPI